MAPAPNAPARFILVTMPDSTALPFTHPEVNVAERGLVRVEAVGHDRWLLAVLAASVAMGTLGAVGFAFQLGEVEYWIATLQLWSGGALGTPWSYVRPILPLVGMGWLATTPETILPMKALFTLLMTATGPLIYLALRPYRRSWAAFAALACALFVPMLVFASKYQTEALSVPAVALIVWTMSRYVRQPSWTALGAVALVLVVCGLVRVAFIWLPVALIPAIAWRGGARHAIAMVLLVVLNGGAQATIDRAFGLKPISQGSIFVNAVLNRGLVEPENGPATVRFVHEILDNLAGHPVSDDERAAFWRAIGPQPRPPLAKALATFSVIVSSSDDPRLRLGDHIAVFTEAVTASPRRALRNLVAHVWDTHSTWPAHVHYREMFDTTSAMPGRASEPRLQGGYVVPWLKDGVAPRFRQDIWEPSYTVLRDPRVFGAPADPFFAEKPHALAVGVLYAIDAGSYRAHWLVIKLAAFASLLVLPILVWRRADASTTALILAFAGIVWYSAAVSVSMGATPKYAEGLYPVYAALLALTLMAGADIVRRARSVASVA